MTKPVAQCPNGHRKTKNNVYVIHSRGATYERCKICAKAAALKWQAGTGKEKHAEAVHRYQTKDIEKYRQWRRAYDRARYAEKKR